MASNSLPMACNWSPWPVHTRGTLMFGTGEAESGSQAAGGLCGSYGPVSEPQQSRWGLLGLVWLWGYGLGYRNMAACG